MSCEITIWDAHVHEKKGKRTLHVTGEGECTSSGHTLRLVRDNEGIYDDPEVFAVKLEVEDSDVGSPVATSEKVEEFFDLGGDPVTRVVVRGAASETVPIEQHD